MVKIIKTAASALLSLVTGWTECREQKIAAKALKAIVQRMGYTRVKVKAVKDENGECILDITTDRVFPHNPPLPRVFMGYRVKPYEWTFFYCY